MESTTFKQENRLGYFFIIPTFLLVAALFFYPLVKTIIDSLYKSSLVFPKPKFVGFGNFIDILSERTFYEILLQSFIWTVVVVIFQFLLGLGSAFLLHNPFPGRDVVRAVVILPWIVPGVITGMLWVLLYDPQLGMINHVLFKMGIIEKYLTWLSDKHTALLAVIFVAIWKGFPFSALMYMAALQGVNPELIDAVKIDGAGRWGQFFYVVIPEISPIIRITLLLTTVWTFNYFEIIYIMTNGGPGNATHIFPTYIYNLAFTRFRFGLAATYAMITFIILTLFSILYMREVEKREMLD
jgi:multiple sugar transport system permease protein